MMSLTNIEKMLTGNIERLKDCGVSRLSDRRDYSGRA